MQRRALLAVGGMLVPGVAAAQVRPAVVASPLPVAVPDAVGLSPQRLAQVTEVLAATVAEGRINGAVLGVARQGKLGWLRAVGFRDSEQREALRPDAIFPLGGVTRALAAVAAMVLVERGRLKLSDPLAAHLPAFREMKVAVETRKEDGTVEVALERARRPITVHDLLRQTAGFTEAEAVPESGVGRLYAEAGVQAPDRTLAEAMEALAANPPQLARHAAAMQSLAAEIDQLLA